MFFSTFIIGYIIATSLLLTIQQISNLFGINIFLISALLATFLLIFMVGLKKANHVKTVKHKYLQQILIIIALLMGLIFSTPFIRYLTLVIFKITSYSWLTLLLFLLVMIMPLSFYLGQAMGLNYRLSKYKHYDFIQISVLGLVTGAIAIPILLYFLGIAWTVFINFLIVIMLAISLIKNFFSEIILVSLLVGLVILGYSFNIDSRRSMIINENNGDTIFAWHMQAATAHVKHETIFDPSIIMINKIVEKLNIKDKSVLILSDKHYAIVAQNKKSDQMTYNNYGNPKPSACAYLKVLLQGDLIATKKKYDLVILDTSDNQIIPNPLLSYNYFTDVRRILTASGIAIFDVIMNPMLDDVFSKRLDNTIRTVFANCMVIPLKYIAKTTHVFYLCRKAETEVDRQIYSENFDTAAWDLLSHYKLVN